MTSELDQVPFTATDFITNPENRCACVLVLDTSGSMQGKPIEELNEGLAQFKRELLTDEMATKASRENNMIKLLSVPMD